MRTRFKYKLYCNTKIHCHRVKRPDKYLLILDKDGKVVYGKVIISKISFSNILD